jgi:hypothetical protein
VNGSSVALFYQLGVKMRCDKCGKRPELAQSCKAERHGRVCSKDLDSPLEEERDVCTWREAKAFQQHQKQIGVAFN